METHDLLQQSLQSQHHLQNMVSQSTLDVHSSTQQDIPKQIEECKGRRNYYTKLFGYYNDLPFNSLMSEYIRIYKDVFQNEKPLTVQRYFVTEMKLVELVEHHQQGS